jgi:hypothetical protein
MRRISASLLIALCLGGPLAWGQSTGEQLIAALEHYRQVVLELDLEHEVSSFTEDAQLALGNEPVVQGRTTIRSLLMAPNTAKVVALDLHAVATRVQGATAIQNGVYSQRFISPEHKATLEKGAFEIQWARQSDGTWLISSLHLEPVDSSPN